MVDRQEKVYAGPMTIGDGESAYGEVWYSDGTAVFFSSGDGRLVTLDDALLDVTPHGLLTVTGTLDGDDQTWTATTPASVINQINKAKVAFTEGEMWDGVTIIATQYDVTVKLRGHDDRQYPGARLRQLNTAQAEIVLPQGGALPVQLTTKRGCGCAG